MNQIANLSINPSTKTLIDTYLTRPAHGLLLTGERGVGLMSLARHLARTIDPKGDVREIMPDEKGTIAIDTVRGLYKLTRTHRDTALVIIIDDADSMGREAQNALLKLLEEPIENIHFILTSHMPQLMLATITSRAQQIQVLPVPSDMIASLVSSDIDPAKRAQIMFLASGLPAEVSRLQSDEAYFSAASAQMKDARAFLESDAYGRLLLAKQYSTDRTLAGDFLDSLSKLLTYMLLNKQEPHLARSLESIEDVHGRIRQNAHVRTQLTYLVAQL